MLGLTWLLGLLGRRRARLLAGASGVAVAVALLASIGSFLSHSKATMTQRSTSDVAVDWQVQAQPGADPEAVLNQVRATPGATASLPVGLATTTGLQATTGGSTQSTGAGVVLGLPAGYRSTFPAELRDLAGSGSGVLLAQQTAANLHAASGDTITVGRTGLAPLTLGVDGVVELPKADSLFQKVGAPPGSQPQAPPDNVVILPLAMWHAGFDALAQSRPDEVHTQVHVRLSHQLPSDPAAAYTAVTGAARNLETRLAGAGIVGDNLASALGAARSDALYAQILFLFLGLPGAALAGVLTASVAGVGADRRRREQALLRARGAGTRRLVRLAVLEALAVGAVGALAGLAVALAVGRLAFGTFGFGATTGAAILWACGSAAVGLVIALVTVGGPAWRDARALTVASARRTVGRAGPPWWTRYGLDFIMLAASALIFWVTSRSGYQLVLAPEGVPTISVDYWAFAGPALLWTGTGLLAWRLADAVVRRARGPLRTLLGPVAGGLSGTVAASMGRQHRMLARVLVVVGLTASFAASTAVFNSTYRHQAEVDARLTNGADVTVNQTQGAGLGADTSNLLASVPGVRTVEPLQHRLAYVGADLQDLYGVRPTTVVGATQLQDAYFTGGSAKQLVGRLAAEPDGILVSAETAKDFQLHQGDRVTLRLQDARTNQYKPVSFRFIGIAKEFPTAPKDSFMITNAAYVAGTTGSDAVGSFLVDTGGSSPPAVAARIRAKLGTSASVSDITTSRRVVGSSLTAVDLGGLTRVELGFALVLVAAGTGLMLGLGLAERRRTFAIARALGARPQQLASFVWAEAAFVTLGGLATGAIGGWALSEMLVKVLTGVFDPPPAALAVPWGYLGLVTAVALSAVVLAAGTAVGATRRPELATLRDL